MEKELFIVEYSKSQRCFHLAPLEKSLAINKKMIEELFKGERKNTTDYIPFFIGTYKETDQALEEKYKLLSSLKNWKDFYNEELL
jgi:hypothetical protein